MEPSLGVTEVSGIDKCARAPVMRLDRGWHLFQDGVEVRNFPLALARAIAPPSEKEERSDYVRILQMSIFEDREGIFVTRKTT